MNSFAKDIARTIRKSLGRFLALFLIVALGCGFYGALRMTGTDMRLTIDKYYDDSNLMDVRVVSTIGLESSDLDAVKAVEGVENASLAYETDITGELHGEQITTRVHSLTNDSNINQITLKEGRFPENNNECVISTDCIIGIDKNIGDKIVVDDCISDIDSTLTTREFEIVGKVESPLYVSFTTAGTSNLGSGKLQEYIYVTEDAFAEKYPYNEIFLTVTGAKEDNSHEQVYQDKIDKVISKLNDIAPERKEARVASLKDSAQEELNKNLEEYNNKKAEVDSQLAEAQTTLDNSKATLDSSKATLDQTPAKLQSAQDQLNSARSELESGKETLSSLQKQLDSANENIASLEKIMNAFPEDSSERAQYQAKLTELYAGKTQLESLVDQAKAAVEAGQKQISVGESQLTDAKSQYYSGLAQYESGLQQYNTGVSELAEKKATAEKELLDAKTKLDEAQAEIYKIEGSDWLIMDRSKIYSVASFKSDAERVDGIAQIFPLFFFLVAALVALTTMTRMIEEERLNIGTYKALGYSRRRISLKFIVYALLASGLGGVVGVIALSQLLPKIIMVAYSIMYRVPEDHVLVVDPAISAISLGFGIGLTLLVTVIVTWRSMHEEPASLMRPKVDKRGAHILLERFPSLWNKLTFSWKVTFRNLLRYKARSFMTIIGIAGCTALLLTGYGMSNAINDIIDKQYGQTVHYNTTVTENEEVTETQRGEVDQIISDTNQVESSAKAEIDSVVSTCSGKKDLNVTLVVPENYDQFTKLWTIRNRISKESLKLNDDGVIICEKLANVYGLNVGDEITICEQDDMGNATNRRISVKVSGIFENYVANYIIAPSKVYSKLFYDTEPQYHSYYAKLANDGANRTSFAESARATGAVKTIAYNDEAITTYRNALKSVDMVVIVLVACAAVLAFIVLYNLNNINICERRREIATLQVLGFNDREVEFYIYRETIILTLLGCAAGLIAGILLESFVVTSAEVNQVMFGRDIHLTSFLISSAITIVFSAIVMFVMRRKFTKVDMVESLKSAE